MGASRRKWNRRHQRGKPYLHRSETKRLGTHSAEPRICVLLYEVPKQLAHRFFVLMSCLFSVSSVHSRLVLCWSHCLWCVVALSSRHVDLVVGRFVLLALPPLLRPVQRVDGSVWRKFETRMQHQRYVRSGWRRTTKHARVQHVPGRCGSHAMVSEKREIGADGRTAQTDKQ